MDSLLIVIGVIIVVCVCLVLIATSKQYPNKEQFDQTKAQEVHNTLRQNLGDSACRVLHDPNLQGNAKIMAMQYIDTERMRVWKPQKPDLDDKQYCYVNNDFNNNAHDYFMAKRSCDENDPFFKSVPFIKNVFSDNNPEKTNSTAVNKCVFEIDEKKATPENLQTFWNNVGTSDCAQLNAEITELNATLKAQYSNNIKIYNNLEAVFDQHTKSKAALQKDKRDKTSSLSNLDANYIGYQNTYTANLSTRNDTIDKIQKEYEQGMRYVATNANVLHQCTYALGNLTMERSDFYNKNEALIGSNNTLSNTIQSKQTEYNLVAGIVQTLSKQVNELTNIKNDLVTRLAKCQEDSKICQADLAQCQQDVADYQAKDNEIIAKLQECQIKNEECQKDVANLTARLNEVNDALARNVALQERYTKELQNCKIDQGRLDALMIKQNAEIDYLRSLSSKDCSDYIRQIQELTKYRDELLARCKVAEDTVSAYSGQIVVSNSNATSQLEECKIENSNVAITDQTAAQDAALKAQNDKIAAINAANAALLAREKKVADDYRSVLGGSYLGWTNNSFGNFGSSNDKYRVWNNGAVLNGKI